MSERDLTRQAKNRLSRIEGQVRGIQGMLDKMAQDPAWVQANDRAAALLAGGKSQAQVARELGISRQRVADVAEGRLTAEGDPCDSLLTQVLAVRAAMEQVGLVLMELHLQRCVLDGLPMDEDRLRAIREALDLWARLSAPSR